MMSLTIANFCFGNHDALTAFNALKTKRPDIQKLRVAEKDTAFEMSL